MKTSKLLITSLLAAAALSVPAYAETVVDGLLPTLSGTGDFTYLQNAQKTVGGAWNTNLGANSISETVVAQDLVSAPELANPGWHWGLGQQSPAFSGMDISNVSATGFTFLGRSGYTNEYVTATVDLSTLLGEDQRITDLSISFKGTSELAAHRNFTFSVWAWDGSSATQVYKSSGGITNTGTDISCEASDLNLRGSDKLFVVWGDDSKGKYNIISDLTSSYTASTISPLYWRGSAEGETSWSSSSTQWNSDSSAESGNVAATSLDDVIFDSSATVAVDSAGVAVDKLTISAGTVSFSGGKVAASRGFFVGNGGTLVLSSAKNLAGNVTVNAGGVFDLNGKADSVCYGEDTDGARLGTVYLNGGVLKDSGGSGVGQQLSKIVLTADSTVTAVTGHFGLAGADYSATELDLGGHTLTKDGAGTFLIITTTIKNGTLSVTEGKISDFNAGAVTLGANAVIDVKENGGVELLTIASMAAGSALKLAGTTDNAVNFNNAAVGANAVVSVSGNSAVTGTITSMAADSSLTLAGTGAASSVTLGVSGSGGRDRQISGDLTIGNATVTTARNDIFNYDTTVDRTLRLDSGGELAIGSTRQSFDTNWKITLNGGKISGIGDTNGYALDFFESKTVTVTDDSEISANLCMRGGNANTLAFKVNADKTLTISGKIVTPATGANAVLVKQGTGTLVLSGDNTYNQGTRIEAGTVEVRHANGLGAGALNVTGDAKLALGERLGISNNISIADSVKLTLGGGYAVALNGAITGRGTLRADMLWQTVALGGDNSGFSGTVEVVGSTVDAAHVSALGTGMVKISSAVSTVGETTVPVSGSIQASTANVALHDVSIELVGADSAALRTSSSGSFTVASGATLYLDIGALTEAMLTGEQVALTIATASAIANDSFFSAVEVGTYVDDAWQISSEWKYLAGSWTVGTGTLTITAIPEPSMFGLLAGLGALALAGTRRRRRK